MPTENAGRSKFSGLADVYSKYRPSYPDEVLQIIRENIGGRAVIADVGAVLFKHGANRRADV